MARGDHADHAFPAEWLDAHFGAEILDDAHVEVDESVAQRCEVLVALGYESQDDPGRDGSDPGGELRGEVADRRVIGADGEGVLQRREIEAAADLDERVRLLDQVVQALLDGQGTRSGSQAAARAHENRVAEGLADAAESAARGRHGQVEASVR